MKTKSLRLLQVALVAILIVALAVPGIALARPQAKNLRAKASRAASATAGFNQPTAQMTKRFQNVVRARQKRFSEASRTIDARIDRVRALSLKLPSTADTSAVEAKLASAEAQLAAACAKEAEAEAALLAIPTLPREERRAAFVEAKAMGREAVAMLKLARQDVKAAARLLRGIVQSMKPTEDSTTIDS